MYKSFGSYDYNIDNVFNVIVVIGTMRNIHQATQSKSIKQYLSVLAPVFYFADV